MEGHLEISRDNEKIPEVVLVAQPQEEPRPLIPQFVNWTSPPAGIYTMGTLDFSASWYLQIENCCSSLGNPGTSEE
ncbi:hypothetical protein ACH5RR_013127 [Cinchona calisaya]|uniref:Uncharacterized protein n=1 Tax=Cinchona calisaya TaxID=153742 RepID=A0ABD3A2F5_9GENT